VTSTVGRAPARPRTSGTQGPTRFSGYLGIAGVAFALALALGAGAGLIASVESIDGESVRFDASIWLLCLVGLAPLGVRLWKRRLDPFEPAVWLTLNYLGTFAGAGFLLSRAPHRWHPVLDVDSLTVGVWIVTLGLGAYWLGYCVSPLSRSALVLRLVSALDARFATLRLELIPVLYVVGLGTRLYLFQAGLYGYLNDRSVYFDSLGAMQPLYYLEGCTRYALLLAGLAVFRVNPPRWLVMLFWAMMAAELFFGIVSGMKGLVFVNFLLLAMACWYVRKRIPKQLVAVAIVGAFFLLPINTLYRSAGVTGDFDTRSFFSVVTFLVDSSGRLVSGEISNDLPVEDLFQFNVNFALERLELLQNVSLAVALTPEPNEFLSGRYYFMLPALAIVPRAVWPDKPLMDSGRQFAQRYWGVPESMVMQATAPTNVGDLYMNFGAAGVAVGMLLLGILGAGFYALVAQRPGSGAIFLYTVGFLALTTYESDLPMIVLSFTRDSLVAVIVAGLVFRRAENVSRTMAGGSSPNAASPAVGGGLEAIKTARAPAR